MSMLIPNVEELAPAQHSFFGTFRQKVEIKRLSELFQRLTQINSPPIPLT